MMEGRSLTITDDNGKTINLFSTNGEYKKTEGKIGDLSHGILLHKSCVFEENHPAPIIIAPDGNLPSAVATYLMARYALPSEWKSTYYDLVKQNIVGLDVMVNPLNVKWAKLKAIRLDRLTEEEILKRVNARLKNGTYKVPTTTIHGQFDNTWSMKDYLANNATVLAAQMDKVKPIHDGAALPKWIAEMKRVPFPAQAHAITALYKSYDYYKDPILSGDMGTGKSIIALGTIYGLAKGKKSFPVLMMTPGLTVAKWIENEIKETLPGDISIRVISSSADALQYRQMVKNGYKPKGIEFIIVGTDRAKLGSTPWCSALYKRIKGTKIDYAFHCPNCIEPLPNPDSKDPDDLAFWEVLADGPMPNALDLKASKNLNGIPSHIPFTWKQRSRLKKCPHCDTKLWRPAVKSRGEDTDKPREVIAKIMKDLGQYFEMFLCDEVHQTRSEDSGRGDAFAQCVQSAKRILSLTGTVTTGKSTSIKEILWRTNPAELLAKGFDHSSGKISWAKSYGVLMQTTKEYPGDSGIITKRKKVALQPIEQPGISPKMIVDFLWHRCVTLELGDLGLPLVELKEVPVFLDMDAKHVNQYKIFHKNLQDHVKHTMWAGAKAGVAKMNPATINYADRPDLGGSVTFKPKDPNQSPVTYTAPAFPSNYYTAKERHLVETVKQELAEGRGIMVYTNFTDSYAVDQRIHQVFKDHGIDSEVLKSKVPQERRTEWLADAEARGVKVVVTNMRLVEVGIDAIFLPSIYFYQMNEDINTVRQSSRRAWRIGQDLECRVYYAVYNGTTQVAQFKRLMTKRSHALLAEGRLDKSELKNYCDDTRNKMALDIAECLATTGLAQKWVALSKKDIDKNLQIVSQTNFKQAQKTIMQELGKETLRLCGLSEDEIKVKLGEVDPISVSHPFSFTPVADTNLPHYLINVNHSDGLNYRFQQRLSFHQDRNGKYVARGFVNTPNNFAGATMIGNGSTPDEAFVDYLNNGVVQLKKWAIQYKTMKTKIQKLIDELNNLKLLVKPAPVTPVIVNFANLGFTPFDFTNLGFDSFTLNEPGLPLPDDTVLQEPVATPIDLTDFRLQKESVKRVRVTRKTACGYEQLSLF